MYRILHAMDKMNIIRLETTESTNLWAKSNLDDLPDQTIVISDRQTNGRGRFDRSWLDLGGDNVFMSFVLKPSDVFAEVYPNLTQYLSVVVVRVLKDYGIDAEIKWPNDVLVNGKKICGILSEACTKGSNLKGIILGIGANLNSDLKSLSQIDQEATALNLELNCEHVNKNEFEEKLISEFFRFYDEFLNKGFALISDEYIDKFHYLNSFLNVRVFDEVKSGKAVKITKSGELVLDDNDKELVLTMGDILSWKN